ncbi:MAG: metalloregulator ArsR/SmtB family transcription factor [Bacillaceae bacterium]|nr:metalloregulator ArsR/SmtB family transcription factor [Bacillaceae bacterium]
MKSREFKDNVYHHFSRIGKVLSSPKRIELLDLLSQSPKTVERLAKETEMSVANTSKHLQALLEARLVHFRKEKNYVIYQLASEEVVDLLFAIRGLAEHQLPEVNILRQEFIERPEELESIELPELLNRVDQDDYVLLDVRPKEEYEAGHIEGSVSIPIDELHDLLSKIPKCKQIIAYCRGPYCVYATEAVELLKSEGYNAYRLDAGVHEWKMNQKNQSHEH